MQNQKIFGSGQMKRNKDFLQKSYISLQRYIISLSICPACHEEAIIHLQLRHCVRIMEWCQLLMYKAASLTASHQKEDKKST